MQDVILNGKTKGHPLEGFCQAKKTLYCKKSQQVGLASPYPIPTNKAEQIIPCVLSYSQHGRLNWMK